jgi:hypothetical protein
MRSSRKHFSSVAVLLAVACAAAIAQSTTSAARTIIVAGRTLTPPEIVTVLTAVRREVSGKIARLAYGRTGPGPLVRMGSDGRPTLMRAESGYDYGRGSTSSVGDGATVQTQESGHVDVVMVTHYRREPAKKCDGTELGAELVIEYEHKSTDNRWTASARARNDHELLLPIFNMLSGETTMESGAIARIDNRTTRAFTAPWTLPSGARAADPALQARARQSLWIDTTTLLPVRWSIAVPADPGRGIPAIPDYGMSFNYDVTDDVRPPDGIAAPVCVR